MTRRYALVVGGGTAGHVVPAVAVARAIEARRGTGSVELVGARRGLEARSPLTADLPLTLLPGRGVVRRLDPASLGHNVEAVAGLALAGLQALVLVVSRRPAVVVSVGGYASVPVAVAAALLGVPVVVCNVDAVPGLANRIVGRLARASGVAVPGTALPRARVTGAPVRPEIAALAGSAVGGPDAGARRQLGIPDGRRVVAVVSGSLGARRVNQAAIALAERWAGRHDVAVHHVVGHRDQAWASERWPVGVAGADGAPGLWYRQVPYEDRMALVYRAADVVVGRAGAMTVAELAIVGVPAVLVPLPGAPGDHQTANAAVLARAGAAVVVPDVECDGARLASELGALLDDGERRAAMARAAAGLGRPDAAEALATLAEAHARPRPHRGAEVR